jgi:hypothetical protein
VFTCTDQDTSHTSALSATHIIFNIVTNCDRLICGHTYRMQGLLKKDTIRLAQDCCLLTRG